MRRMRNFAYGLLAKFWQWRDPVPTLAELKFAQYENKPNPSDNIQQAMNLVIPLKNPTAIGRARLVEMLAGQADAVMAGLHNTGIVHFARFTLVGNNLVMFSIYDGDFTEYIREFINNIGTFFDHLMQHTLGAAPTPVEDHPDDFVAWVKSVDAWQLGEDITAVSDSLADLPRRLALTLDRDENIMMFLYRAYPGNTAAQVRNELKVGW